MSTTITLDNVELATVLAALRYWQRAVLLTEGVCPPEFEIARQAGGGLRAHAIDALCERVNCGDDEPPARTQSVTLSVDIRDAAGVVDLLVAYLKLHDGLSDMIEGGRLTEADCPDDYQWLVDSLAELSAKGSAVKADIAEPKPADEQEDACRAAGWREHQDTHEKFIWHAPTWGSWKAAASWAGTDNEPNGPDAKPATYETWADCYAAEIAKEG